jgi:dienelactone hydrolase
MNAERLNAMLEACVRDLADNAMPGSKEEHRERTEPLLLKVRRSLGLEPLPPRTELDSAIVRTLDRESYRLEVLRFESRPGIFVSAHLYLPTASGPHPVVIHAHGRWSGKKSAPWVQARGIGLALQGVASLVVDSPGAARDEGTAGERVEMGPSDDLLLSMGAPATGAYVWDLIRAVDYCESRLELDARAAGVTGEGPGGCAAALAFALDDRLFSCALACSAASLDIHEGAVPRYADFALLSAGDWAEVIATRAPAPILLMAAREDAEFPLKGVRRTHQKLAAHYRLYRSEEEVRLQEFEGGQDYNRRMRECASAFFLHTLGQESDRPYRPEPIPMTDGAENPYPCHTSNPEDEALRVDVRSEETLRGLLGRALSEPYPVPFDAQDRLLPWAKYGRLPALQAAEVLRLRDEGLEGEPGEVELFAKGVDLRACVLLGIGLPEVWAQTIHYRLPGKRQEWERQAMGGPDALSSMIASVRTFLDSATAEDAPKRVVARGELASLTAQYLRLLRPELEIETSHSWRSWTDIAAMDSPVYAQPSARYLKFPF